MCWLIGATRGALVYSLSPAVCTKFTRPELSVSLRAQRLLLATDTLDNTRMVDTDRFAGRGLYLDVMSGRLLSNWFPHKGEVLVVDGREPSLGRLKRKLLAVAVRVDTDPPLIAEGERSLDSGPRREHDAQHIPTAVGASKSL